MIILTFAMIWVMFKLAVFGIKAAGGITKLVVSLVFLPVIIIGLVLCGLFYLAVPILIIIGVITLVAGRSVA